MNQLSYEDAQKAVTYLEDFSKLPREDLDNTINSITTGKCLTKRDTEVLNICTGLALSVDILEQLTGSNPFTESIKAFYQQ